MLNSVHIDSFLRIAYLKMKLAGAPVHIVCGPNENGKSTLGEAIRFAIRGLSPRVRKKGAYGELIHRGKKSGSVEIDLDGYPIHRTIKDGKVTTKAALDYPDLLVDIQLGATEFALAPTSDVRGEMGLRSMLHHVFQVGAQDEFIRARLKDRGVTEEMMKRTLPLIRVSGFDAAAETAKDEQSRARGEWEGITHETYGSVKAQSWRPEILSEPAPDVEAIALARSDVKDLTAKRDELNKRLGGISESLRLQNDAGETPIAELEEQLQEAEEAHAANETALRTAQEEYRATAEELQEQIGTLEADLQNARQAAATLDCPCCGAKLNIKTKENVPLLVKAEKTADSDKDIRSLAAALSESRNALTSTQADQNEAVQLLQGSLTQSQMAVVTARNALERRRAAAARPLASEDEVETIAEQIATLDQQIAEARSHLQDLEEKGLAHERAAGECKRAAKVAQTVSQWAILAEALGSGPNGIPAELVAVTTKPINAALAKLALPWDTSPIVMSSDLSVSRADGTPYYLLSKSGQWKANAMMQLALAAVSNLKLVVLDGFDVIQPTDRGAFIDMLTDFATRHPDITVLALGTLKTKPVEQIDGVRFYWIQDGQLKEAA